LQNTFVANYELSPQTVAQLYAAPDPFVLYL